MTTSADLAVLTANATSPIRDSRSPAGNRLTTSSVTIDAVGSTFGAAPSISIYREGSNGTPGELLHVTGTFNTRDGLIKAGKLLLDGASNYFQQGFSRNNDDGVGTDTAVGVEVYSDAISERWRVSASQDYLQTLLLEPF